MKFLDHFKWDKDKHSIYFFCAVLGRCSFPTEPLYPHILVHSVPLSPAQDIPPDGVWVLFSGGTARETICTVGKACRAVERSLTKQDGNVSACLPEGALQPVSSPQGEGSKG